MCSRTPGNRRIASELTSNRDESTTLRFRPPSAKLPCSLLQDVWHSAWHFWWCAAVPWGDLWRITCCEVFEFSEEFAGSHEKPATIRPALDPRQVRYQAALRPDPSIVAGRGPERAALPRNQLAIGAARTHMF